MAKCREAKPVFHRFQSTGVVTDEKLQSDITGIEVTYTDKDNKTYSSVPAAPGSYTVSVSFMGNNTRKLRINLLGPLERMLNESFLKQGGAAGR